MQAIPTTGSGGRRAAIVRSVQFVSHLFVSVLLALQVSGCPGRGESASVADDSPPATGEGAKRLISLNPSLTAIIFRLRAGDSLVAVDDYSAELFPEETSNLPRVGGLFNPNLESIVALGPDRVLLVAGVDQQTHGARIENAGVATEVFENERLDQVLENIERLGRMLGREREADQRISAIRKTRAAVTRVAASWPTPATVAVLDRSPFYVVGGETFLDEMLEAVGAKNLGRRLGSGYPRGSIEWLIESEPVLLLDLTPDEQDGTAFWKRWPSLPAVVSGRVLNLDASRISLPGPAIDEALIELAVAVHGSGIAAEIEAGLVIEGLR